jgi:glycosyltransferase involved in cell wall biosynthesis
MSTLKTTNNSTMVKDVFVSVVMTVYNGEDFLKQAVDSVLTQTHTNFEFVIIDDGSEDSSANIIQEYMRKDGRIKFFQQKNEGLPIALNKGIELASSEIIVRMDADDIMLPYRLEKQLAYFLAHPEASVVSCCSYHINSQGKKIGKGGSYSHLRTVAQCKEIVEKGDIIFCLHPGVIYRKSPVLEVGGYDKKIIAGEDVDLWNRLADKGYYTIVMPERLILYRIHGNAFTGNAFMKKWDYINWMFTNIRRRRNKEMEISFEEFKMSKQNSPLYKRLNDIRICYGAVVDRNSAVMYGEGNYFGFGLSIIACLLLRPRLTIKRLKTHLE